MAINEVYVDPSLASDTGAGTSGDPYGDLEWCLETITPNANGDRINIKAGTDEVLAVELGTAIAVYGTPSVSAPLVFQGYTSAAGDGGVGGISGGGSVAIVDSTALDYVTFIDCHLHNTGTAKIIDLDIRCALIRCEIDNSTNSVFLELGGGGALIDCYIHNCSGRTRFNGGVFVYGNYFENGTNEFSYAVWLDGGNSVVMRNIIHLSGTANASNGIIDNGGGCTIMNNSIWSDAGSGSGIWINGTGFHTIAVMNNLVEGFSATNGFGIEFGATTEGAIAYGANSVENCDTDFDTIVGIGTMIDFEIANESLAASPFNSASTGDFAPVDTGAVKEGSVPDDFYGQ